MDIFLKAVTCAMIAAVFCLVLGKRDKDMAAMLSIAACCLILVLVIRYLEQLLSFFYQLQRLADLDEQMLQILLKCVAIGVTAHFAELICKDFGHEALGKTLQFLASVLIIVSSLPVLEALLEQIGKVLGGV